MNDTLNPVTATDHDPAVLPGRKRWLLAIGYSLVPVVFTAVASAVAQSMQVDDTTAALFIGVGAAISALVGLVVMRAMSPTLGQFGFRAPRGARYAMWFIPLVVSVMIVGATGGVHVAGGAIAAYALLTVAVAFNEEIWFRGIVLAVLRAVGVKTAVIGSSVLFGVLHLANLASGQGGAASVLQVVFAIAFGFVAAELLVITRSLWPAIVWHAAWDFMSFLGGNSTSAVALAGVGAALLLIVGYAIALWPRVTRVAQS